MSHVKRSSFRSMPQRGPFTKLGEIILEGHLKHCVRDGIEHGDAEKTIAEFAKALQHFCNKP